MTTKASVQTRGRVLHLFSLIRYPLSPLYYRFRLFHSRVPSVSGPLPLRTPTFPSRQEQEPRPLGVMTGDVRVEVSRDPVRTVSTLTTPSCLGSPVRTGVPSGPSETSFPHMVPSFCEDPALVLPFRRGYYPRPVLTTRCVPLPQSGHGTRRGEPHFRSVPTPPLYVLMTPLGSYRPDHRWGLPCRPPSRVTPVGVPGRVSAPFSDVLPRTPGGERNPRPHHPLGVGTLGIWYEVVLTYATPRRSPDRLRTPTTFSGVVHPYTDPSPRVTTHGRHRVTGRSWEVYGRSPGVGRSTGREVRRSPGRSSTPVTHLRSGVVGPVALPVLGKRVPGRRPDRFSYPTPRLHPNTPRDLLFDSVLVSGPFTRLRPSRLRDFERDRTTSSPPQSAPPRLPFIFWT